MSGGSFNYLYRTDSSDIQDHMSDLQSMADELTKIRYAEDAAAETEEIFLIVNQFQRRVDARIRRLSGVWQAVEWWRSRDSNEGDVKSALETYRESNEMDGGYQ
jgi:hypothetical protein